MINLHLYLREAGESIPGRWREAFPEGKAILPAELASRLRSHDLAHVLLWIAVGGPTTWSSSVNHLLSLQPQLKIVLLSGVPNDEEGLLAIQAGVRGYSHTHAVATMLKEIALVVEHGGLWLGPDLMRKLVTATSAAMLKTVGPDSALASPPPRGRLKKTAISTPADGMRMGVTDSRSVPLPAESTTPGQLWQTLTSRERQIAYAVASGRSNKEIAALMHISQKTVKAHLGSVFQKLDVRDRLQLVVRMADVQADDPRPDPQE